MLLQNSGKWDLITPKDLSNFEIDQYKDDYKLSQKYAKNYDLCRIQALINQNKFDKNLGLLGACEGGHRNLAEFMIEKGANDWNWCLYGACQGNSRELAEFMIEKGAYDWNQGLCGACKGGSRELAEWMIEKGAYDWNYGLWGACLGGHRELAKFMIEKGATYCAWCDKSSEEHNQLISFTY